MSAATFRSTGGLVASVRAETSRQFPLETRQSFPIPVMKGDNLLMAFLFCHQFANTKVGLEITAPHHQVLVNVETGQLVENKEVIPSTFGQPDTKGAFIGAHTMPPGMTASEYLALQEKLYSYYDVLLPHFARKSTDLSPDERTAANEFKGLFSSLSEKPLQPYYSIIGKDFFSWVDSVASLSH